MSPEYFLAHALEPALKLLPAGMDTAGARAMVVAVCLQESRLQHRAQIGGPARSYAQFELGGGVRGVLTHPASKPHIRTVLSALDYSPESDASSCYVAIEHNDILAAAFSRLLLWTLPGALPARDAPADGWTAYTSAWRPGKPRRETWDNFYSQAWSLINREKK